MATINLEISRFSVCAADDVDAPHSRQLAVSEMMPIKFVIRDILASRYLPSIAGGHATWIVEFGTPVAVIAQQWSEPKYIANPDSPVSDFIKDSGSKNIRFKY